jgi:hypothetical protein
MSEPVTGELSDLATRPHALYRFFDAGGALLYVGITVDIGNRWPRHADDKPWWYEVARTTVEHHPSRPAALAAEKAAIEAEGPRYNVRHNGVGLGDDGKSAVTSTLKRAVPTRGVLREHDVVAVGLWDGQCPVGIVTDIDDVGVRLDLFSFLDGAFSGAPRMIMWAEVAKIVHAREQEDHELVGGSDWLTVEKAKKIHRSEHFFDTIPLENFQSQWRHAHMPKFRCDECGTMTDLDKWRPGLGPGGECSGCERRRDR